MVGFELAGIVAVDPSAFSLRELFWMAESKLRSDWQREAVLAAFIGDKCGLSNGRTEPNDLIPERYRIKYPPIKVTKESNEMAWALLGQALKQKT